MDSATAGQLKPGDEVACRAGAGFEVGLVVATRPGAFRAEWRGQSIWHPVENCRHLRRMDDSGRVK